LNEAQTWRRWAGQLTAGSYELTHEREYWAVRNSAALFDVSPLMSQVMYTPWCDEAGKVIDDGTLARLDTQTFRMTSADPNLRWLNMNAVGLNVDIQDHSESVAALSLQGPSARAILNQASDVNLERLKYFRLTAAKVKGLPVTISRTGYTGDLGYEIWAEAGGPAAHWRCGTR
jgi:aminomethyltransferase